MSVSASLKSEGIGPRASHLSDRPTIRPVTKIVDAPVEGAFVVRIACTPNSPSIPHKRALMRSCEQKFQVTTIPGSVKLVFGVQRGL